MKILIAVDGSKYSLDAVNCVIDHADWYRDKPTVELVTVHRPVPRVGGINKAQLQKYYDEEGEACLKAAKKKLDAAKLPYRTSVLVGPVSESLVKHAKSAGCDLIFIGTRGMTAAANAMLGSTATKVLHISTVPVLVVM